MGAWGDGIFDSGEAMRPESELIDLWDEVGRREGPRVEPEAVRRHLESQ